MSQPPLRRQCCLLGACSMAPSRPPSPAQAMARRPIHALCPTKSSVLSKETAWLIWVAATCPVNTNPALYPYVVWETWIEQSQLYPADPSQGLIVPNAGGHRPETHPLHGSPLALTYHPGSLTQVPPGLGSPPGAPNTNCNAANAPPPNNTGPNGNNPLTICEEIVKAVDTDYISGTGFWNRPSQAAAAGNDFDIQFPRPAVEIKADWIQV